MKNKTAPTSANPRRAKRLTINRIAGAGLRANRRGYLSLGIGIFLSIFLISALCLSAQGVYLAQEEKLARKFGYADGFWLGGDFSDETLTDTGLFESLGRIYVTGRVTDSERYFGYYDETAGELMNRRCVQGRMPENPGEIALENSVLESLRMEAEVGDTLALSVTPIDGIAEEREYTLVGILAEQTAYLSVSNAVYSPYGVFSIPSILVSDAESAYSTGRVATQYALTLKPLITVNKAFEVCDTIREVGWFVYMTSYGPALSAPSTDIDSGIGTTLILIALLGLALALSTGVGISGAMEGQLARKTEEIGLLRAVGATRRQIRRVFGREAWLIALLVSPLAVGAGCGFCALLARVAPGELIFRASPYLLIPIFLLSALCILLSASLPLRRASRVMPMSVLRDTDLLRKSKNIKGKSRFSVAPLIAWRQNRLNPTRQIGAALMVALMCICLSLLTGGLVSSLGGDIEKPVDYELTTGVHGYMQSYFDDTTTRRVTEQDIAQLAAIPGVESMETTFTSNVTIPLDDVPAFLKNRHGNSGNAYLLNREEFIAQEFELLSEVRPPSPNGEVFTPEDVDTSYWESARVEHDAARDALGVDGEKTLLSYRFLVCEIDPEALKPFVGEGRVDIAALDEGREVLAYLPNLYVMKLKDRRPEYIYYDTMSSRYTSELYLVNDTFSAGQRLDIIRATCGDADAVSKWAGTYPQEYDDVFSFYSGMEKRTARATVGAVLRGGSEGESIFSILNSAYSPCLITTPKGAAALGLGQFQMLKSRIYLSDDADEETVETSAERVETIAMRGDGTNFYNNRKSALESERLTQRVVAAFASILVLFFCVSVAMITGGVTRRIRADSRMIGTLRAVGADANVIRGCYEAQVTTSVLSGLAIGLLTWAALSPAISYPAKAIAFTVPAVLFFGALCYVCCREILALRVDETMRRSIVENIREL